MDNKKILSGLALLLCAASFAQNINPTVEVTNTYQGNPSEVHKPQLGMAVPDSLLRFDMDFGYEVFDKPYQGAYNFKPYMLSMKPGKDAYRGKTLYLKAGAGYSLHPQLDFVFSPEQRGPFQMSVYANHRSYFGRYNSLGFESVDPGILRIGSISGHSFTGYDALTSAGFEGRYDWDNTILSFNVGYNGLMTKDTLFKRSFNAADFGIRVRSNRDEEKYLYYDVALDGRFAGNHAEDLWTRAAAKTDLRGSVFGLHGEVGPTLDYFRRVLLGFEAGTCSYGNLFEGSAGLLALIPKYQMETGKWDFSLGLRVEKLFGGSLSESSVSPQMYTYRGRALFPDVHIGYAAADNIRLFADATGGSSMNTYSSLIFRNHFLIYGSDYSNPAILDFSTEKINVKVGVKGNFGSKLQFELNGGAAIVGNGPLDNLGYADYTPSGTGVIPCPAIVYSDYSMTYANLLLGLGSGNVRLDAGFHFRNMSLDKDDAPGFLLPKFACDLRAIYDFNSRVYAGTAIKAATSRSGNLTGSQIRVPGYLDLGLLAGYQFTRRLGFWLESGNLLCESIQRYPMYSEKDLWITAGITLSL